MSSTLFGLIALGLAVVLFGVMLLVIEIGRRIGTRAMARDPVGANAGKGIVDGAVFGIVAMLFALVLVSALLVGYGMAGAPSRNWVHMAGFALAVAMVVYVILDLEFPRLGLTRLDEYDRVLADLRQTMN